MKTLKRLVSTLAFAAAFAFAVSAQTNLVSLDGSRVNVEGQTGKIVVLAIGASWNPLSGKQAMYTNAIAKKYANKNVAVYFVATDSANSKSKNYASVEMLRTFASTNKLTVPVLQDADGITLKKFKIDQVPSFVILDKNGSLANEQFGGITTDAKYDVTAPISKVIDRLM